MTEFVPTQKGTTIRYPSTAQLTIDSIDRVNPTNTKAFDFQVQKTSNIMNGFFTRLSATEVMLDWAEPNIQTGVNSAFAVVISGVTYTIAVPQGFYTVKELLDTIVVLLNATGSGRTFAITNSNGQITLGTNINFTIVVDYLAYELFSFAVMITASQSKLITEPDIRLYRYLDFTSPQITYAQDVKDSSTNQTVIDSICRFYMAYDESPSYDAYGFPILLGYKATSIRRAYPFPKQIKWENNIPIGNLTFQVYVNRARDGTSRNEIIPGVSFNTEWSLTLQVSEV